MKLVMCVEGIDISIFKFYSIRMVLFVCKFLMVIVWKIVGWKSDSVFWKFYNKFVVVDDNFSKKVLEKYDKLWNVLKGL